MQDWCLLECNRHRRCLFDLFIGTCLIRIETDTIWIAPVRSSAFSEKCSSWLVVITWIGLLAQHSSFISEVWLPWLALHRSFASYFLIFYLLPFLLILKHYLCQFFLTYYSSNYQNPPLQVLFLCMYFLSSLLTSYFLCNFKFLLPHI